MSYTKNEVQDFVDELECHIENVRSYSGRYMYGKKCVGVVCDVQDLVHAVASAAENNPKIVDMFKNEELRTDSMGMDWIFYWPNIVVEDEDED